MSPSVPGRSALVPAWWRSRREELLALVAGGQALYVYHRGTVLYAIRRLRQALPSVDAFYYSMKANSHPLILQSVISEGLGLECVSAGELERARDVGGSRVPLLFTPNFCPVAEYETALHHGAEVVVDGPEVLTQARGLFAGREIGLRLDPGWGRGHHPTVVTGGAHAKFGLALDQVPAFVEAAASAGVRVVGLHAHVGSGILDPDTWSQVGETLLGFRGSFPEVRWISVGGGLGVPERPGSPSLDLERMEEGLAGVRRDLGSTALRMEPGRFLVSEAGVLLAPVTQLRVKSGVHLAGVATGMNSLLRPALYDAWHGIHNLSRLGESPARAWQIVGPICENGDVLARDRWIPDPRPGDVLLIENAGAYGAVMASHYNLRAPAGETVLD